MNERGTVGPERALREMAEITRRSYAEAVDKAFEAQKENVRLSRTFFEHWVETLEAGAEMHRRAARGMAEVVREQQDFFRELSRESFGAYDDFLGSLSAYYEEAAKDAEDKEP